jgi:hypothetical protein
VATEKIKIVNKTNIILEDNKTYSDEVKINQLDYHFILPASII